jgi:hypothetical protein
LADVAAERRDADGLRQFAPLLEELAMRDEHIPYLGIARRALGVAHLLRREYAAAHAQFSRALQAFASLGMRWQTGRTHLELGDLAFRQLDQPTARSHWERAVSEFEALGAKRYIERSRAALHSLS